MACLSVTWPVRKLLGISQFYEWWCDLDDFKQAKAQARGKQIKEGT